jgi:hypothetical protein
MAPRAGRREGPSSLSQASVRRAGSVAASQRALSPSRSRLRVGDSRAAPVSNTSGESAQSHPPKSGYKERRADGTICPVPAKQERPRSSRGRFVMVVTATRQLRPIARTGRGFDRRARRTLDLAPIHARAVRLVALDDLRARGVTPEGPAGRGVTLDVPAAGLRHHLARLPGRPPLLGHCRPPWRRRTVPASVCLPF